MAWWPVLAPASCPSGSGRPRRGRGVNLSQVAHTLTCLSLNLYSSFPQAMFRETAGVPRSSLSRDTSLPGSTGHTHTYPNITCSHRELCTHTSRTCTNTHTTQHTSVRTHWDSEHLCTHKPWHTQSKHTCIHIPLDSNFHAYTDSDTCIQVQHTHILTLRDTHLHTHNLTHVSTYRV